MEDERFFFSVREDCFVTLKRTVMRSQEIFFLISFNLVELRVSWVVNKLIIEAV